MQSPQIKLPFPVGRIHFVGIGGIGMSGIARVMNNLGYDVTGSDVKEGAQIDKLRERGVTVHIGHDAVHAEGAAAVVVSTAIRPDNPEMAAARAAHIPVVRRADMLAELMRLKFNVCVAGTHGKTTTTSMVAAMLDAGDLDPTVINGGVINAYASNARAGQGDWMVVEADESDGSFLRLPSTVGVITNIDPEHLDHYGDFGALRGAFDRFVENIPFYGFGVVCLDHAEVQSLVGRVTDRRLITYGLNPQADVRATNITAHAGGSRFDVVFRHQGEEATIAGIELSMPGEHNVLNATAAAIVARELGITDDQVRAGFARFEGVGRRFSDVGTAKGVRVIDDYGHHPVEIAAVLKAARTVTDGKVVAVMQPHRFSRLAALFDEFCGCFNDADTVLVGPVFAAGEAPIDGASQQALTDGLKGHGHRDVRLVPDWDDLPDMALAASEAGDLVICLGAGDITKYANALPAAMEAS